MRNFLVMLDSKQTEFFQKWKDTLLVQENGAQDLVKPLYACYVQYFDENRTKHLLVEPLKERSFTLLLDQHYQVVGGRVLGCKVSPTLFD